MIGGCITRAEEQVSSTYQNGKHTVLTIRTKGIDSAFLPNIKTLLTCPTQCKWSLQGSAESRSRQPGSPADTKSKEHQCFPCGASTIIFINNGIADFVTVMLTAVVCCRRLQTRV